MYKWSWVIFEKKSKFHNEGGPDTVVSPSVILFVGVCNRPEQMTHESPITTAPPWSSTKPSLPCWPASPAPSLTRRGSSSSERGMTGSSKGQKVRQEKIIRFYFLCISIFHSILLISVYFVLLCLVTFAHCKAAKPRVPAWCVSEERAKVRRQTQPCTAQTRISRYL